MSMRVEVIRSPVDQRSRDLLEQNYRLRHKVFVELQGWKELRREDGREVDVFDNDDTTNILITEGDMVLGGSRITPLDKPNLLQTVFSGLVQGEIPAHPSLGADWTRFYVHPSRRDGGRRTPASAALFFAVMDYALREGFQFITFVSSIYMVEYGIAVGWRIQPLGKPVLMDGKPSVAAWIEVSEAALGNLVKATGVRPMAEPGPRRDRPLDLVVSR